jgi:hypothetical protein
MSSILYSFTDADGDTAGVEGLTDRKQGPVVWLQTSNDGCYVPVDRLDEFIAGLRRTGDLAAKAAAADEALAQKYMDTHLDWMAAALNAAQDEGIALKLSSPGRLVQDAETGRISVAPKDDSDA